MDPIVAIVIAVATLALGLALGWVFASKQIAPYRAECETLRQRCGDAERAQATAEENARQTELRRVLLEGVVKERDEALQELRELKADARNFEVRLAEIVAAKDALSAQFSEVGAKLLSEAHKDFLNRANQRFDQASERNEAQLKAVLAPVGERLKSYEEQVAKVERERTEAYGHLTGLIDTMRTGQEAVASETARLAFSLRGNPKIPGDWGQHHFENLLELTGLTPHVDYEKEKTLYVEGGRIRPDFIINLPQEGKIVVDIKCSLDSFLEASKEEDPNRRKTLLTQHSRAVAMHADALAKKSYFEDVAGSPDYVIMYIPGDHYFAAAMDIDPQLWRRASDKRVIISSPATFVPVAHSLAAMWRNYKLNEDAQEIARRGRELYERLCTMTDKMRLVGGGLQSAIGNYNEFVGSLEGSVLPSARRFKKLGLGIGDKAIPELDEIPDHIREPKRGRDLVFPDTGEVASEAVLTPGINTDAAE